MRRSTIIASLLLIAMKMSCLNATEAMIGVFVKRNTRGILNNLQLAVDANVGDLRNEIIEKDEEIDNNMPLELIHVEFEGQTLNDNDVLLSDLGVCSESIIYYDCTPVKISSIHSNTGVEIPILHPIAVSVPCGSTHFLDDITSQIRSYLVTMDLRKEQIYEEYSESEAGDVVNIDDICIGFQVSTKDPNYEQLRDILPNVETEDDEDFFVQDEGLSTHWVDTRWITDDPSSPYYQLLENKESTSLRTGDVDEITDSEEEGKIVGMVELSQIDKSGSGDGKCIWDRVEFNKFKHAPRTGWIMIDIELPWGTLVFGN